ncbi:hypothetical protein NVS55_09230 [Myxococcus stipitatus]|uniref:hypothetical protein n=1 Tax=Myxococcus stipitatus TaxID=83455 RepID=UPI003144D9BB
MDTPDNRLAGLILTWLAPRPQRRGTRSDLEKTLRSFVEHRLSRSEWKSRLDSELEALLREGLVKLQGKATLELTPSGSSRVLQFLRVEQLPKGLTWKKLKATYLLAHCLDLPLSKPVAQRLSDADGMRAAVLAREYPAVAEGAPSLSQLRDRLLWKQLGVDSQKPFSLRAVQAHLLGQLLETEVKDPRKAVEQLAARAAGASRTDAEALRQTLLRDWAFATPAAPARDLAPPPTVDFAERVLSVARALPTGRFGRDKVFISHVWKALQPEWSSREAFDAALLEANRTQKLSLTRADLVSAMNPTDVAESEVRSLGASFHFVVI